MKTTALKQLKIAAMGGFALALGFAGVANASHNSRFTCYVHVHETCFNSSKPNCSQEEYEWGLDECDNTYPNSKPVRKPAFGALLPGKSKGMSGSTTFGQSSR
ncbi:MAG: hypothetical protein AAF940_05645 [Pseudomonadota bacterium]